MNAYAALETAANAEDDEAQGAVLRAALERYLGQPSLVRETSRNVLGFRPKAGSRA